MHDLVILTMWLGSLYVLLEMFKEVKKYQKKQLGVLLDIREWDTAIDRRKEAE